MTPASVSVIVLAGGAGTRIRHLYPDRPKPLIPVAGRPFLDWICGFWASQGVHRVLVSLGHQAEIAERHLVAHPWPGMEIRTLREERPLGTGGAVRFAAASPFCTDPFVVTNGDSLVFCNLSSVWPVLAQPETDGALLALHAHDATRYGSLSIAEDGSLIGFLEKRPGQAWINAGVYFFKKRLLPRFPGSTPLSMEFDVFPALLASGARLQVVPVEGDFLDIGTPEELARADAFITRHRQEFAP
jgi:NDP-sugar pyrophosphorylase family protein